MCHGPRDPAWRVWRVLLETWISTLQLAPVEIAEKLAVSPRRMPLCREHSCLSLRAESTAIVYHVPANEHAVHLGLSPERNLFERTRTHMEVGRCLLDHWRNYTTLFVIFFLLLLL